MHSYGHNCHADTNWTILKPLQFIHVHTHYKHIHVYMYLYVAMHTYTLYMYINVYIQVLSQAVFLSEFLHIEYYSFIFLYLAPITCTCGPVTLWLLDIFTTLQSRSCKIQNIHDHNPEGVHILCTCKNSVPLEVQSENQVPCVSCVSWFSEQWKFPEQ